ncbi:uncharacterized protein LOC111089615, partial [Limulus polyphemus]|uniref:Uncharacterized protein LOC111089615 n=1 Tax=Limulus polyphemus TaxID=6850 RepID=A0ABM1TQK5_LIMPO
YPTIRRKMSSDSCVIGWDPVRVTAIEWRPWVRVFGKGENFTIDGVLKDLLDSISSSMNFSYVLVDPRGTKFCPKGLYCINEMLHMLANKSAEIALFNYQVRLDRDGFANFPGTMYIDHGSLLLGDTRPGMSVHFEKIFHWK